MPLLAGDVLWASAPSLSRPSATGRGSPNIHRQLSFTVNFVGLLAVPPGVVMDIVTAPGASPEGTSAVTSESETTVNVVAFTVPNFTAVA